MSGHHIFLQSELAESAPEDAFFHVIPAPLEASVSYGAGTALGPEAIIRASDQLELWDGASIPAEAGIYTGAAVDCSGSAEEALSRIESAVGRALACKALPVLLGGEHTVTLGALRAINKALGGERFGIVLFDAHADLREIYEGNPLSHACVMRRALEEYNAEMFQIGVRALSVEEHVWRQKQGIRHLDASELALSGVPGKLLPEQFPKRIYISFDVDCLDPSVMPATGTPVPGGLSWREAMLCLERCVFGRTVLGFDVVEFAPANGLHFANATASQLVYAMTGITLRGLGRIHNSKSH